jgi:nucleoside-diphosphate-sugar epimerase
MKEVKSRILITGGAGLLSNLCEYFLSKEHEVVLG